MIANLIVVIFGTLMLWLWCRRDAQRAALSEEKLARKTQDTWRAISADLDKLIELEIVALSPEEQARLRTKLAAQGAQNPPHST